MHIEQPNDPLAIKWLTWPSVCAGKNVCTYILTNKLDSQLLTLNSCDESYSSNILLLCD